MNLERALNEINKDRKIYQEWRQSNQERFNSLPIYFAFGKEQFKEVMNKLGLTENDTDKLVSVGQCGFMLKKDKHILNEWLEDETTSIDYFKRTHSPKEIVAAIYDELWNREFMYNYGIREELTEYFELADKEMKLYDIAYQLAYAKFCLD